MKATVEELPESKVRMTVEVPSGDVQHAIDHAASDLAGTLRIPGFHKGKVPMPVLLARVGKERLYTEAVESHIGGWFRAALRDTTETAIREQRWARVPEARACETSPCWAA